MAEPSGAVARHAVRGSQGEQWTQDVLAHLKVMGSAVVQREVYDYGELYPTIDTPTRIEVTFAGARLVLFSETKDEALGASCDLSAQLDTGIDGAHLYLDDSIWKIHAVPLKWNSKSGKTCVACGQIHLRGKVYGCWINMMYGDEEWDTEHTHRHDELLVQLAGSTSWALVPKVDKERMWKGPGETLLLPARRKHILDTYNCNRDSLFLSIGRISDMKCPCSRVGD